MTGTAAKTPRGLDGVVAAQTRLSHVDGQAGELIIGGYALQELAGNVTFEAAAHLLWKGALPSREDQGELSAQDRKSTRLNSSHLGRSRMPSSA